MSNKQVKVHYRRLRRDNGQFGPETLSNRIAAALETPLEGGGKVRSRVLNRQADVPGQPGFKRLLNNFNIEADSIFGTLCLFAPGQMQALLRLGHGEDAQASLEAVLEAFDIAEAAPPEGHEYIHGICYFLAVGDHFYQIQSISLQVPAMEEYLTWLLRDRTGAIKPEHFVMLQSTFDRAQVGDDELTSIQIGGLVPETVRSPELFFEPALPPEPVVDEIIEHERIGDAVRATLGQARAVLIQLLGEMKTDQILQSVPPEAALEVTVNIGFKAKKRKLRKAFMNELETGLRNLPDGEIKARGRNGEVRGDDARLSLPMGVKRISDTSGLLDLESARAAMIEVHRRFLFDGKITS
jgi:hypothetical protein